MPWPAGGCATPVARLSSVVTIYLLVVDSDFVSDGAIFDLLFDEFFPSGRFSVMRKIVYINIHIYDPIYTPIYPALRWNMNLTIMQLTYFGLLMQPKSVFVLLSFAVACENIKIVSSVLVETRQDSFIILRGVRSSYRGGACRGTGSVGWTHGELNDTGKKRIDAFKSILQNASLR